MVCWFSSFWHHFDLAKQVKFGFSRHFPEIAWRECPEILHADVSWPPSALISYSHGLLIFLNLALFWRGETAQCYPDVSRRMHWGNSLKFCLLMYPDHFQNWLDFGHALLIFLMVPIWLSETGHIWGLQGLSQGSHTTGKTGKVREIEYCAPGPGKVLKLDKCGQSPGKVREKETGAVPHF